MLLKGGLCYSGRDRRNLPKPWTTNVDYTFLFRIMLLRTQNEVVWVGSAHPLKSLIDLFHRVQSMHYGKNRDLNGENCFDIMIGLSYFFRGIVRFGAFANWPFGISVALTWFSMSKIWWTQFLARNLFLESIAESPDPI